MDLGDREYEIQQANLGIERDRLGVERDRLTADIDAEQRRHQLNMYAATTERAQVLEQIRHNAAVEVLTRSQAQLDARNSALNRRAQERIQGTFAERSRQNLVESALKNPWLKELTGMAPDYADSGGPAGGPGV